MTKITKNLITSEAKRFWGLDIKSAQQIHNALVSCPVQIVAIEDEKLTFRLCNKEEMENFSLYLFDLLYKLKAHDPILGCHNPKAENIQSDSLSKEEKREIITWQNITQFLFHKTNISLFHFEFENKDEHHMCEIIKNIYRKFFLELFTHCWSAIEDEEEKQKLKFLLN
jgi:hypothetical protein